ncbi:response regulator transcription factor [Ginsengibacter hankyongi]|uniref:Response regulator transcription factor n=1 Tax=Ginsengibacter hankyongi TaxID=2607284 RepID=A0A5J5IGJ9_9BACT|nr:response regulator transcription factor [Ginsengibacter hankyongi]KAA9039284.1 response regulator transcription factor [Ginsengibacter hankyongi]
MIQILLADDHAIIRAGLKTYIQNIIPDSNIEEAFDGNSTFEKIKDNDYALIILDINMPATDSFGLVSNILAIKPESKILMFSMNSEEIFAKKYLNLGALGYLNKDASADEIKHAINNVMSNKRYMSSSLTQALTDSALGKKANSQNPFDLLSSRELEIVRHLMKGESVSQIGAYLNLHTSTVGTHKARILEKLNCKNVIGINELARVHNFIQPD